MIFYVPGRHEDQVYIHPSDDMKSVVRIELDKITLNNDDKAVARRTIWKPYLATSASRTPSIVGKTELAIRRPWDYPFGQQAKLCCLVIFIVNYFII